jgi:hypothetical protein
VCEVDHSPSSAKAKNEWSYASTHPLHLHGHDKKKVYFLYLHIMYLLYTLLIYVLLEGKIDLAFTCSNYEINATLLIIQKLEKYFIVNKRK